MCRLAMEKTYGSLVMGSFLLARYTGILFCGSQEKMVPLLFFLSCNMIWFSEHSPHHYHYVLYMFGQWMSLRTENEDYKQFYSKPKYFKYYLRKQYVAFYKWIWWLFKKICNVVTWLFKRKIILMKTFFPPFHINVLSLCSNS